MDKNSDRPYSMRWPAIVAILQGGVWSGLCVFLLWYVPQYERIYRDFKMELPAATIFFIDLTHFLHDQWIVAVMLMTVWMGANFAVVLLLDRVRSGVLKSGWYFLTVLVPILFLVAAHLAIALPLIGLIGNLSK